MKFFVRHKVFTTESYFINFFRGEIGEVDQQLLWKFQNIDIEDYLERNLVSEIESLKIIDEVNLFHNRPESWIQKSLIMKSMKNKKSDAENPKAKK